MILEGKRVWVIGSTGTIGSAIVKRFKQEGAKIIRASRLDFGGWVYLSGLANKIQPDVLVNCVGILGPVVPIQNAELEDWVDTVNVNLIGPAFLTRAVLPGMIEREKGKIIHFSGGGAAYGISNRSAYAASKAGLVRFVECIAEETLDENIQINAIAPGPVKSKMNPDATGTPEAAVELALFLASEKSNHITGRLISAIHDDWKNLKNPLSMEAGKLRRIPLN